MCWAILYGAMFCIDLVYQMEIFATTNASATSTEEFRQKLAEVDAMLRHMKAVDFSFQRATAAEEYNEAQKCEYSKDHICDWGGCWKGKWASWAWLESFLQIFYLGSLLQIGMVCN